MCSEQQKKGGKKRKPQTRRFSGSYLAGVITIPASEGGVNVNGFLQNNAVSRVDFLGMADADEKGWLCVALGTIGEFHNPFCAGWDEYEDKAGTPATYLKYFSEHNVLTPDRMRWPQGDSYRKVGRHNMAMALVQMLGITDGKMAYGIDLYHTKFCRKDEQIPDEKCSSGSRWVMRGRLYITVYGIQKQKKRNTEATVTKYDPPEERIVKFSMRGPCCVKKKIDHDQQ